ncbi:MAG: phosphoglycerate dehydrogenase [Oscillospiraceae bacterium]|nr:phosphoglycerate dehydrogenase [Oscillospiraceae bacterium]
MYNIKTLNKISPVGLSVLDRSKYAVSDECEAPDAILVRSAKMHEMVFNPELLCIGRAGAGTNNIPVDRCAQEGIVVFNSPGANAEAVKELALCALLLASRDIAGGIRWVDSIASPENDVAAMVEKGKSKFVGPEILGKKLGIIGLGAIGAKLANAATALGMTVYGYDPFISVDGAWRLSSEVIHTNDMDTIFAECDYISIHVPYNDKTKHTINAETIAKMKDGVRLLNLARGELVDDDAIIEAIKSGKVARYVTDFPNNKTAGVEGIVAIPHLGASTPESEDNCAFVAAKEIVDYIENGNITNSVNMPAAVLPRSGDVRVCVIHKNVPEMISKITGAVSAAGLNIENMLNASRKDFAYTIIDTNGNSDALCNSINAIDGVIRVRVIG